MPNPFLQGLGKFVQGVALGPEGLADLRIRQQQLAQQQAEFQAQQKYQEWQMSQKSEQMPVYTIDPTSGEMRGVGIVPKGAKVISPSMMYSPEQKADIQVSTAARKDEGVRNQKLKGLMGTIDFFEQKIGEIPAGAGLMGRIKGSKTAIEGMLQTNPDAAAYMASVEGMRSQIARGLGEVGNLSEYEQKYAVRLLPGITDNAETRAKKIQNFRDYITKKIGFMQSSSSSSQERIKVKSKDGKIGTIPASQLEQAISEGYSKWQ